MTKTRFALFAIAASTALTGLLVAAPGAGAVPVAAASSTAISAVRSPSSTSTVSSITLRWTNPTSAGFTGVMIRRNPGSTAPTAPTAGTLVANVTKPVTTVTDSHLAADARYSYALFAHDAQSHSPAVTVTTRTLTTIEAAPTWSGPTQPFGSRPHSLRAVSCTAGSFCLAVDSAGHVKTRTSSSSAWSSGPAIGSPATAVSCASPTFCMAITVHGARVFDGSSWTGLEGVPNSDLDYISCASSTLCVALNQGGDTYSYDGSAWTIYSPPPLFDTLTGVSCVAPSTCVAVGTFFTSDGSPSESATFNGTTWSDPISISPDAVSAVSCGSSTSCVAIGTDGVITFDGTRWSVPQYLGFNPVAVSCASRSFCVAVGGSKASVFVDRRWSTPSPVSRKATALTAVTCSASGLCLAIDDGHNLYTRTVPKS